MKKLLSIFALLSVLLTSCEGFEGLGGLGGGTGSGGELTELFDAADLEKLKDFKAEGGYVRLTFTPDFDWSASSNRDWIIISPESGLAGEEKTLRIELTENTSYNSRKGNVTIELANSISYKLEITQLGSESAEKPTVELIDGAYYEIVAEGGQLTVKVNTNTEYEVYIPSGAKSWLSVADTRAMHTETLTFSALPNDTGKAREAACALFYGSEEVAFVIYQEAKAEVEEPIVELVDGTTYTANPDGGDITIKVLNNVDYEVEIPTIVTWLHKVESRAAAVSTFTLHAEKNDSGKARSASLRLTYEGGSPISFTVSQEVGAEGNTTEGFTQGGEHNPGWN